MGIPRLILEVAPDEEFHKNIRRKFVSHLNPVTIEDGTVANYAEVNPPGSGMAYSQYTNSDREDITFSLLLNEFGASFEDLDPRAGHMTVDHSLRWLALAQLPVKSNKVKNIPYSRPPVLLLIFGERPVIPVTLRSARVTHKMLDNSTAKTIRAEVSIILRRFRKIGI